MCRHPIDDPEPGVEMHQDEGSVLRSHLGQVDQEGTHMCDGTPRIDRGVDIDPVDPKWTRSNDGTSRIDRDVDVDQNQQKDLCVRCWGLGRGL